MTIQLNLGKLAKSMSAQDKIRLLLENANRVSETAGKESVLSPSEREAIIADARKKNEIPMLNRAFDCYRTAQFILIDLEIAFLRYMVFYAFLERHLVACFMRYEGDEIIGEILYDLQNTNIINKEVDKDLFEKYVDKKPIWSLFSYYTRQEDTQKQEPNTQIQTAFMQLFSTVRSLEKKLFQLEYVMNKVGYEFISETAKAEVRKYRKQIDDFVNLENEIKPIRMYRDFDFGNIKNEEMKEPEFIHTLKNIGSKLKLTDEEQEETRAAVDSVIEESV